MTESSLTEEQTFILAYVRKYAGWHTLITPKRTKMIEQVEQLHRLGLVELNADLMIRVTQPSK